LALWSWSIASGTLPTYKEAPCAILPDDKHIAGEPHGALLR
jgi:hypothetical protein